MGQNKLHFVRIGNAPSLTFPSTLTITDSYTANTKVMDVSHSDDYGNNMDYDIFMEEWTDSSGYFELDLTSSKYYLLWHSIVVCYYV